MTCTKVMNFADYQKRISTMSIAEVHYALQDAFEAGKLADSLGSPNSGFYWDEVNMLSQELRRRSA